MLSKNKVLCSTGTIIGKSNNFDYRLISGYAGKIIGDGFEFIIEPFWSNEEKTNEIITYLKPFGINFETLHMDKDIGSVISKNETGDKDKALRIFELNCQAANELGARLLVLHLWGGIASDNNIDANIKIYAELLEIAGRYNLILTVENVVCYQNPLIHMKKLYNIYGNAMKFTFDVRHAAFHGIIKDICEAEFLWENNLVPHFHIADYNGGYMNWSKLRPVLPPGDGDIDFGYIGDFIKKVDYKGSFTLEASGARTETGNIDFEKLNEKLNFIYDMAD